MTPTPSATVPPTAHQTPAEAVKAAQLNPASLPNLSITDIRDSSAKSLASASNLAQLIVSSLSTKSATFPASSAHFDRLQNGSTSPFHLSGSVTSEYGSTEVPIRSISTLVLYDDAGLDIYDQITYIDEYYLTNAEMQIFMDKGDEIIETCVGDGGVLIELGVGSMRKTKYLLDAIVRQGKSVTYYALDLSAQSLSSALTPLAQNYPTISFVGLLGTYDDSLLYIQKNIPRPKDSTRTFFWLGSSIGNYTRDEAAAFLRKVNTVAMETGDTFLCGIDRRNDAAVVKAAYDDPKGITRDFILNGLKHTERILGYNNNQLLPRENFEYVSIYNEELGRHEAYYRSLVQQTLKIKSIDQLAVIELEKGELINIEYSVKYNAMDVQALVDGAGFYWPSQWADKTSRYDVHLFQKAPFTLMATPASDRERGIPTVAEFEEIFKVWDVIFMTMIPQDGYLERPISLRHPYIFYVGHLPAFMDIQLSRCLQEPFTEPAHFADIFERGIDPDVNNPEICHAHSVVPDSWPSLQEALEFSDRCKERIRKILKEYESGQTTVSGPLARILWMSYEHYAMHIETFLYMLVQSPNIQPPKGFQVPVHLFAKPYANPVPVKSATWSPIRVPTGVTHITLGHNDSEKDDVNRMNIDSHSFGWDNEHPERKAEIPEGIRSQSTRIQSRQVTVGEYFAFLQSVPSHKKDGIDLTPASWTSDLGHVKTAFGLVELRRCINWPVYVSAAQATAYAQSLSSKSSTRYRLPTELELTCVRAFSSSHPGAGNYGFRSWVPRDVTEDSGIVGDGWELTCTELAKHDGYEQSSVYPGYSSDFFDGKHDIVLGGSWATAPRLAQRKTFRNWYQRVYPFVFASFRLIAEE